MTQRVLADYALFDPNGYTFDLKRLPVGIQSEGIALGQYRLITDRISEEKLRKLDADGRIWWGKDGINSLSFKLFLSEVLEGVVPQTIWFYEEVGHNQAAKQH